MVSFTFTEVKSLSLLLVEELSTIYSSFFLIGGLSEGASARILLKSLSLVVSVLVDTSVLGI